MSEEVETETVDTDETATDAAEVEETEEQADAEKVEDPAAGLKSALQKERAARKALEKQLRDKDREISDRDKSADEKAIDAAKREAAAEATRNAFQKVIQVEFRAAAKERGIDPKTAVKLADLGDVDVDDDGEVDADAITAALDAVLEEHPSLSPSRFKGTADQGSRGKKPEKTKVDPNELIRAAFQKS